MLKDIKRKQEGFTIIEVMIVLVIAAVILLIVFLAVPALQRNSRNTQRKNDVAGILGGINEYSGNNSGAPVNSSGTLTTALGNVKLGYYTTSNVTYKSDGPTANPGTLPTTDEVFIYSSATCSGNTLAKQSRGTAALYQVESGSGSQAVCQAE